MVDDAEVVIFAKIGMLSYRTTHFNENSNHEAMKFNLDLIDDVQDARKLGI